MWKLTRCDYIKENVPFYGNSFLLGNGHIGYKGTLEEYKKDQLVSLNIVGFYDKSPLEGSWRESLNAPNPFFVRVRSKTKRYNVLSKKPLKHKISLDLKHAVFSRVSEFDDVIIASRRFIDQCEDNFLALEYVIKAKCDNELVVTIGLDKNIYEINGPHYLKKKLAQSNKQISFFGLTNEGKKLYLDASYAFPYKTTYEYKNGFYRVHLHVKENGVYRFYVFAKIQENEKEEISLKASRKQFINKINKHKDTFAKKFLNADVKITGNNKATFAIRYAIYHLLILGSEKYITSIPARGVSGQTYKGAIFWDSEIFLLPFYMLTNPLIAKNLLLYRLKTLPGALKKAKEYNYSGAFYAWESQDDGLEACSKYNVSDPITNEPIRTYFNEAQIHISADIAYALNQYIIFTGDESILKEGGLNMLYEIVKFYMSFAVFKDGKYHFDKVIGPDEYHELIDDNAFTNYMVDYTCEILLKYLNKYPLLDNSEKICEDVNQFKSLIYLPSINKEGIIEQFKGYFDLEDITVNEIKKRVKIKNAYWGTKDGIAFKTRVIKQADVLTLMTLLKEKFTLEQIKNNYHFYLPYTEHGSSLSSSMYAISGFLIGEVEEAYNLFLKSALIDLSKEQKLYAGGIYIGGSHPASVGGAYMSLIFGFLNLEVKDDKLILNPRKYKLLKGLELKIHFRNKVYKIRVNDDSSYVMEEIKDD